jgi:deoxyribonuclease-4
MLLRFGTAGIPLSTPERNTLNGIRQVRSLGLDSMELEFVQSVNITMQKAPFVKEEAIRNDVTLTCHASYYINLNSLSKSKIDASKQRLLDAVRVANTCGAYSVAFHPAFYHRMPAESVYKKVKEGLSHVVSTLQEEGNLIWVRPEVMGRVFQFGTLKEVVRLSQELDHVLPCVDFGHLHGREGKFNTYEEFADALAMVEVIGKEALKNMHMHIEGVEYNSKGEKRHINLDESDLNYCELIRALKDFKAAGVVVSESPNIEADALLLKSLYNR